MESLVVTVGHGGRSSGGGVGSRVDLLQVADIHDVGRQQAGSAPWAANEGHGQLNKQLDSV